MMWKIDNIFFLLSRMIGFNARSNNARKFKWGISLTHIESRTHFLAYSLVFVSLIVSVMDVELCHQYPSTTLWNINTLNIQFIIAKKRLSLFKEPKIGWLWNTWISRWRWENPKSWQMLNQLCAKCAYPPIGINDTIESKKRKFKEYTDFLRGALFYIGTDYV